MRFINLKYYSAIITALLTLAVSTISVSAATFTVTNTNDSGAGSLRQAITDANQATGADTIAFDGSFNVPRTITLTSGQLLITNGGGITINGPGTNLLTVSGNNQSRVFEINDTNGTLAMAAIFYNFTISNASIIGVGAVEDGVSIGMNNGNAVNPTFFTELTLNNVAIVNVTVANQGYGNIYCRRSGVLTINNSYIGNNLASPIRSGSGGGSCQLNINNSTIEKNSGGDGLIVASNTSVTNSTINDNVASNNGSAFRITLGLNRSFNLTNTTIVRNRSNGNNSAAVLFFGSGATSVANLTNVTIANNFSASNNSPAGFGVYDGVGTINLKNTIIANNFKPAGGDDFYVYPGNYTLNSTYSLVENLSNTQLNGQPTQSPSTANGNIVNVDPLLDGALRNYGGATKTLALRRGSPAIDAGDPTNFPTTDQRGVARPQDGDNNGAARSDIGAFERRPIDVIQPRIADFDGDGLDDVSVFRPSNGVWYLQQSYLGFTGISFGQNGDVIVPADYDGDGRTDVAVYRNGIWYLQRSTLGFTGISFGQSGDIPVPGDYDGDEKSDVAVFRPANGTWYLLQSTAGFTGVQFGQNGDRPTPADYDGDGKVDVAVFRPSTGTWYMQRSQLGFTGVQFGDANDRPAAADFDGDGKTDIAVFRPATGTWYIQRSQLGFTGIAFGQTGDAPAPADYDGDGRADVAVFRAGTWYLNRSTSGFTGVSFGAATDKPVPNAFIQ